MSEQEIHRTFPADAVRQSVCTEKHNGLIKVCEERHNADIDRHDRSRQIEDDLDARDDRRTESRSLRDLHTKIDGVLVFIYGDPRDPKSPGVKGILADYDTRIKSIEKNKKAIFGFASAAGVASVAAWLSHLFKAH